MAIRDLIIERLPLWQQLLLGAQDRVNAFLDRSDEAASIAASQVPHIDYAPAADIPANDTKTKLVRLDKVIGAMHVMTAQIALHAMPGYMHKLAFGLLTRAENWGIAKAIGLAAKKIPEVGTIIKALTSISQFVNNLRQAAAFEAVLRKASVDVRKALIRDCFPQQKGERRVKDVSSRHKTRKKRKPNKGSGCKNP